MSVQFGFRYSADSTRKLTIDQIDLNHRSNRKANRTKDSQQNPNSCKANVN